jgi:N6-L-threonylcarbamoyladenine synthase
VNDIAAAFQKTVVRTISNKLERIYEKYNMGTISIAGGVAANLYLKNEIEKFSRQRKIKFFVPSMKLCTDNGAMIAYTGWQYLKRGIKSNMDIEIQPDLPDFNLK